MHGQAGNRKEEEVRAPDGRASESYLVRIYRRDAREPSRIAGLVEIIEEDKTEQFRSAGELMEILGIRPPAEGRQAMGGP